MKVLFDTRLYVYDKYLEIIAEKSDLTILERIDLNNKGGIRKARSHTVTEWGRGLGRFLSSLGLQISLPNIIRDYQSIVSAIAPDVIVVNDLFHLSSFQALAYKKKNNRVRLIVCSEIKRWPKFWLAKKFMQLCFALWRKNRTYLSKIITYTNDSREFLLEQFPQIPIIVVPPAIDTEQFLVYKERTFLPDGVLRIIMNARFFSYKRHETLLKTLVTLSKNGYPFLLTLVSRDEQGRVDMEKLVKKYMLDNQVVFSSSLNKGDLIDLMKRQDVLVLPSYNEAIGMVVPEAMALGVPTITSDTVGANVYVQDGVTGFIFETDNEKDLFRCLVECYDTAKLKNMSENGALHIAKEHSIISSGNKLAREIYE